MTNSTECQWFLNCDNRATHMQSCPTLGDVPICDRCQEKSDKTSGPTRYLPPMAAASKSRSRK